MQYNMHIFDVRSKPERSYSLSQDINIKTRAQLLLRWPQRYKVTFSLSSGGTSL